MPPFKTIRARAAKRKGGEAALASLLPKVPEPQGAGQARRRPHAGGDGQARLLGGLRVERHRQEVAGLRGRPSSASSRSGCCSSPTSSGRGLAGDKRIVRNPQKIKAVRDNARFVADIAARARQLRQVPRPSGRPTTRSACSSCSPSAARGSAAAPASTSCASSARTASSPRPTWSPACATPASTSPRARPPRRTCAKIQDQFNAWAKETGLPLTHLSRICAMSIGENYDAETLQQPRQHGGVAPPLSRGR